jgi:hypothetical protein
VVSCDYPTAPQSYLTNPILSRACAKEIFESVLEDKQSISKPAPNLSPPPDNISKSAKLDLDEEDISIFKRITRQITRPRNLYELLGTESDQSDDEEEKSIRPPMLRKKSGEAVRPVLRASARRRPNSMPGTPTFSKAVHFDSHLEHVQRFDQPQAVSADDEDSETYWGWYSPSVLKQIETRFRRGRSG